MKGDKMNDLNKIVVAGTVECAEKFNHSFHGNDFYCMRICTKRDSGTEDFVPVIFSDILKNHEEIKGGDKIQVFGSIRTNRRYGADGDKHTELYMFVEGFEKYRGYDMNCVNFSGSICNKPIYRETPLGREICDYVIKSHREHYKSSYIPCIAWNRNAYQISKLDVWTRIILRGRFQSRTYNKKISDEEYEVRTAYEISCSSFEKVK